MREKAMNKSTRPEQSIFRTSVEQVLEVYGQLVKRTVLHAQLPAAKITLKTETPLTRSEAIQALKTVLAMNKSP